MRENKIGNVQRVEHLLDAIAEIENYTLNITFKQFVSNSMMRIATVKQLEIIGEVCAKLSNDLKLKYPKIEWAEIVSFRNVLVHEYFGVNFEIIWETVVSEVPVLKQQFQIIKKDFDV